MYVVKKESEKNTVIDLLGWWNWGCIPLLLLFMPWVIKYVLLLGVW